MKLSAHRKFFVWNSTRSLVARLAFGSLFVLAPSILYAQQYSTSFPLTENPVSEGGRWAGGSTAGSNLWGDVQTTPGLAFGVSEPTQFGDPTAILQGTWGTDQTVEAMVKINTTPTGTCCHEAEVRLRNTISANSISGYEVYCSVMPDNPYCHIASWGGPNGAWVNMDANSPALYLKDGDVLKGTVTGTNPVTITMFINGVQVLTVQDTGAFTFSDGNQYGPWVTGNPGLGFYNDQDSNWNWFGFSKYTASAGSVPFAAFTAHLEIERSHRPTVRPADSFEVEGRGVLGTASQGIAPDAEDVTLSLGSVTLRIPAGSFVRKTHRDNDRWKADDDDDDDLNAAYLFKGVIAGVSLKAVIEQGPKRAFTFNIEGRGADLSGVLNPVGPVNPVQVGLAIGNDAGSAVVKAHIE